MNELTFIMHLYMYELEQYLLTKKQEILDISFQSDEANTDRPLKEYLKNLIESEFNSIPNTSNITFVNIENIEHKCSKDNFKILNVLLPDEINDTIKNFIKESKKSSVYTHPDICLKISYNNSIYYETIELKSTKNNSIPGSSVQQIIPNEWVIFIKHSDSKIDIVTGKYINSINSKLQFPDRSPRPQVSFKELKDWNLKNRKVLNSVIFYYEDKTIKDKHSLIKDWQAVLSERWIDILLNSTTIKNNEPWFNNNLRKFIIRFLNYYDLLSKDNQEKLKNNISNLIKEDTD